MPLTESDTRAKLIDPALHARGWTEHRGLPVHKISRLWKFKLSEVDAWVRAGGTDAPDEEKRGGR